MYEHNREAWPENYLGAVSLTFDDGDRTQLERAAPMMEERDFRGAFYLCPKGDDYAEALKPWVDVTPARATSRTIRTRRAWRG